MEGLAQVIAAAWEDSRRCEVGRLGRDAPGAQRELPDDGSGAGGLDRARPLGWAEGRPVDLVYGSALWFTESRVSSHHLTERLSSERPVLYVESVGARAPRAHEWRRIVPRLLRSFRPLRRVGRQLWVFSPLPLPAYGRVRS